MLVYHIVPEYPSYIANRALLSVSVLLVIGFKLTSFVLIDTQSVWCTFFTWSVGELSATVSLVACQAGSAVAMSFACHGTDVHLLQLQVASACLPC